VTYRGSEEERSDLLKYYMRFKGDMDRVFSWLMLSRPDLDSHRFRDALEVAIAAGELKLNPEAKQ
jgi:DnaJ family protein C protein 9